MPIRLLVSLLLPHLLMLLIPHLEEMGDISMTRNILDLWTLLQPRPTTNLVQSGSSMHVSSRRPLHRLTWVLPSIWLGLLECCSTWFLHLPLRVTLADGTTIQSWRHAPPEESVSLLYCEACQFGKHQSFFWSQDRYKSLTSFSVSSFRCRGSFPYVIPFRHSIFYGIVYDYSRITSLYLMKTNIQNCLK